MPSSVHLILVLSAAVLILGVLSSAWKRRTWGIQIVLGAAAVLFVGALYLYQAEHGRLGLNEVFVASWLFLFVVFFVGMKHVMQTGFLELNSFENFRTYLKENKVNGAFPTFLLYLGPALFFSALAVLIVDIIWRFI